MAITAPARSVTDADDVPPAPRVPAPSHPLAVARRAVAELRGVLRSVTPEALGAAEAAALTEIFATTERVGATGKARYARRAGALGVHEATGHPDAARWLATLAKEPVGKARSELATAAAVATNAVLEAAVVAGELSGDQATVLATAAGADPGSTRALVTAARHVSFAELKERAARARRAARAEEDERAAEARIHARRYCRTWRPGDGGLRLEAWVSAPTGARILAALDRATDAVFAAARQSGEHEPIERYRADALVGLLRGNTESEGTGVVVHVDAAALRRGALEAGEICEIQGVGPVSVATARSLLGDAAWNLLVSTGTDVTTITSKRRTIPRALRLALVARDRNHCVVPGCPATSHLEIDHWKVDFALGGPTELSNLALLCARHHAMKTAGLTRLVGGPGRWRWVTTAAGSGRLGPGRHGPRAGRDGPRAGAAPSPGAAAIAPHTGGP